MSILGSATKPDAGRAPVRLWLYGGPDVGKTHFAVQFPRTLLLSTDGNYVYEKVPANSLDAWEVGPLAKPDQKGKAFMNLLQELKTTNEYDTVVLDLVDGVHRLARSHYLKLLNIVHESDLAYGKAYTTINQNFISAIEQLFKLPLNIIIISHQASETIKPKNATEYTIFKPKLDEKFHDALEGYCNLVTRIVMDVNSEGQPVRKLILTIKEIEYGINRLGQTEDLILTHNGDNYGDFIKIWQELYDKRGLGVITHEENKTRKNVEKDKAEGAKAELLKNAKRAEDAAAKIKADKVEEAKVVETEDAATQTSTAQHVEVTTEAPADDAAIKAEKLAAIKKAKATFKENVKEAKVEEEVKVEKAKDDIDDGEPTIERTDAVNEKMARIKALKAKAAAAANK